MENKLEMHYPYPNKLVHKDEFHITNPLGQLVATLPVYENLEFSEENAKLIVKAVNNHERLIAALKRVYDVTCIHSGTKVFSDAFANELKELLQSIEKQ